ncbi:unnamed protein product, partial [Prorocentrum cordatum]
DGKGGKKGKKSKDTGKGDGGKGGKGGRGDSGAGGDPAKLPRAPGAQFLVAKDGPSVELETHELEQLVATLEKLGDTVSLAKHRRTLHERRRLQQEALYVPPMSQRVTHAHKQVQDVVQKLEKAVMHFERLEEGLESQRRWVQSLCEDMETKKAEHRKLVVELNRQVVDISQVSALAVAPISVAGILDGSIEEIPLSFAGLGFDDAEYEMDANDRKELAERSARLKSELSNAVKQMFGQAAEKAKLFKEEQEAMALRLAGKRRRQGTGPEDPGPAGAAAADAAARGKDGEAGDADSRPLPEGADPMDEVAECDRRTPLAETAGSLRPAGRFWRNKTVDLDWPQVGGFLVPALDRPDEGTSMIGKQYCKQLHAEPEGIMPVARGRRPVAMGPSPDVADPARQQAIQDFADMRADLRDWAAARFDSHSELETDSGHWRRWYKASLGTKLADGGGEPLRRLLRSWFPDRGWDSILDGLCLNGRCQAEPRRIAFVVRLNRCQPFHRWQLEHRRWRHLEQIRAMFLRFFGDRAPGDSVPPQRPGRGVEPDPPRRPVPDDDQAMDYVDNLTAKLVMLSYAHSLQLPGGGVSPGQANLS